MELNNTLRLACPFGGVSGERRRKVCAHVTLSTVHPIGLCLPLPRLRVQCFVCLLAALGEYGLTRTREEKLC